MNPIIIPQLWVKLGKTGLFNLGIENWPKKENSVLKPVKLHLKIDCVTPCSSFVYLDFMAYQPL